MLNIANTSRR